MTVVYSCPCLNVKIYTAQSKEVGAEESSRNGLPFVKEADGVEGHCAHLGLGGITVEHNLLVISSKKSENWTEVACLNCTSPVYFSSSESSKFGRIGSNQPSSESVIVVCEGTISNDEMEKAKSKPGYSDAYRIVINKAESPVDPSKYRVLAQTFHTVQSDLDSSLGSYISLKKALMEEKIAAFRLEEQEKFELLREKGSRDRDELWARMCETNASRVQEFSTVPDVTPESEVSPTTAELSWKPMPALGASYPIGAQSSSSFKAASFLQSPALSFPSLRNRRPSVNNSYIPPEMVVPPSGNSDTSPQKANVTAKSDPTYGHVVDAAPANGVLSVDSEMESVTKSVENDGVPVKDVTQVVTSRRVRFAMDPIPVVRKPIEDEEVFGLDIDGVGVEEEMTKYVLSDDDSIEMTDDESDAVPISAVELLSSSVPVSIPRSLEARQSTRQISGSLGERLSFIDPGDDDHDDAEHDDDDDGDTDDSLERHVQWARSYTPDDIWKRRTKMSVV